jgi:simple sugar transport system permease protein
MLETIISYISSSIPLSVPLMYGSTGEIITEKSGHLNLGIPGIMYVGSISSVIGAFLYENACAASGAALNPVLAVLIPLLSCLLGSVLMGLIYSFLTVTLRVNQNVTGLALTTFGVGLGNFFGGSLIKLVDSEMPFVALTKTSTLFHFGIPGGGSGLGWFGQVFLSHDFLTYIAILTAIVASIVLAKTRVGLNLRAVGENPATADAAGINVTRYKYLATCIGSAIAGLGGLQYVMVYADGVWSNNAVGDRGWMAIALVIFALWKPWMAIIGSFLFGMLCNLNNYMPLFGVPLGTDTQELFNMLPYVVTIIVLIITSMRKKREHQPPQSLGLSYFREDR